MNDAPAPARAAVLADEAEALAFADLYAAAPAHLQTRLGLRVERLAGATVLLAPGMPSAMFNRVIGLGLQRDANVDDLESLIGLYRRAGAPGWWLHWSPFAGPSGMPPLLAQRGFTQPARRSWAKVLHASGAAPHIPTDLDIGLASDAQAGVAAQVIAQVFEMPPFMADWLRCLHGRPGWWLYCVTANASVVGGGCLFRSGDLAWLGMAAVLPSHRRRGGQGALMARRIADAAQAGARHIVTETGEPIADEPNPSLANMKRCGFAVVASRLNYAGPLDQAP